ncbi:tyrosine-protein kinase Fer isoform X1 [Coccinella septempunctata]|uniref:tyrosine-protein kinase Fer isoform X1 n=2 Tax=Coccinella septempunctata TaxID=41139 RepID=UPI001D0960C0|nr:tyrosine-protein kinase Fer isoform X1 [Coccinella septempunctata]
MVRMGFSSNLQGKVSHDAIITRQDAELRLLELMKRCLVSKVKCDREYAVALSAVATQGLKMDKSDDLCGSLIASTWRTMMEELDNTGKLIKQNADSVESRAIDSLNCLYAEKRKIRKLYQEEYNRIQHQLTNITEEVTRKKLEYQKYLELYKLMRTRFEEYYVKAGRGGKKLDEVRDKYQKACRKLHLTHNEYVLLLCEAVEFEKDFRTVLLPGLLERQQNIQEDFILIWKQILIDVSSLSDLSSEKFKKIQKKVGNSLEAIRPTEEYKDFTEKFKTGPVEQVKFVFDESLIEDSTVKFLPNQLTVDNLTVDWLRNKLADLESSIKESEEKRANISTNNQETPLTNGKSSSNQEFNNRIASILDNSKKEIEELKCSERKMLKQTDLIKSALNELGCEEVPSGCDLSIDNPSFTNENTAEQSQNKTTTVFKKSFGPQKIVKILRKPFRRKSAPSSPVAPPRTKGRRDSSAHSEGAEPVSSTWVTLTTNKSLVEEEWFHGVLPREEVVRLLVNDGDFLVRETTRNDESQTVLSVCWGGHKHFIVQTTAEGQFRFEGPAFPSIRELILYQFTSGLPVTGRSGALLMKPIPRERWELNNDDVILLDKIGRGNFGDVYRAQLKNSNEIYAVKTCRGTLPEDHKKKFLQEGRILKQYDHPNIVKLIGICVQKQPIMIVMELVPGGSLLTFLRKQGANLNDGHLMKMCLDVAAGMRYLESKNCIHRDLAARNCLIGYNNVVKISDFGMSREEEEYIVSDGMKQIPIKWTAPEALNFGKYTSLCDVWSYGILCWEIFSRGGTPYSGMSNSKARERIDAGYRMPASENTPEEMYRLMLRCWEYKPENRPNFEQVYTVVETLCNSYRTSFL